MMKVKRDLMCASLLSALATCLSPATAAGQATPLMSVQGFTTFFPTIATPGGNANTATNFTIPHWTSTFAQSGIFVGMPSQDFGTVTLLTNNPTSFVFGDGVFGHFASTSITRTVTSPTGPLFDMTGLWTPGTYCNAASGGCPVLSPLIRQPFAFPAEISLAMSQVGGASIIETSATLAVITQSSIIGPSVATDAVVQPIARQMGLTTLGTLHERVGDAAADAACLNPDSTGTPDGAPITKAPPLFTKAPPLITKAPPVPYCQPAVWGRLFGQQIDNHYESLADPRATGQVVGIQTGVDLWRGSLIPGHRDTAGLYFAYGNGHVGVDGLVTNVAGTFPNVALTLNLQHTGSVNLNAYSVGGYWTHYGPTGWYVDTVLQGSFYNGNASTPFTNLPTNGTGFISSLETGYPIPLSWFGPRFVLEPEGQIIWQQVSFDDANDDFGPVGLGTTSGASGRLGLRGKWTINDPAGRAWQPYVLANVWRDWGGNATTMFGGTGPGTVPVPLFEQATRLEFAGGLSAKILSGLSLYAQAGYQFAVSGTDGGKRDGVKGDFGVHYAF